MMNITRVYVPDVPKQSKMFILSRIISVLSAVLGERALLEGMYSMIGERIQKENILGGILKPLLRI